MKHKYAVLIVDDDADDREIFRDAFSSGNNAGEYVCLENGEALLTYLRLLDDALPALILLDLNMPGKDGREALREIKGDKKLQNIPVVVFTTSSSEKDKQNSYNLGANCFITKPGSFTKLLDLTGSIKRLWLPEAE